MAVDTAGPRPARCGVRRHRRLHLDAARSSTETELVSWIEGFEGRGSEIVVDHGGRIIKNIGDEVLFVADDVPRRRRAGATDDPLGADPDDDFPEVRAGLAHGEVVSRLATSSARRSTSPPGSPTWPGPAAVLVDQGRPRALSDLDEEHARSSVPTAATYVGQGLLAAAVVGAATRGPARD